MKNLSKTLLAIVFLSISLLSCKKEKKQPVGALGPNFPYALNSIITPEILASLKSNGVIINEGIKPPLINGIYLEHPQYCTYDDAEGSNMEGTQFADYVWKFSNQDNSKLSVQVDYKALNSSGSDVGTDANATFIGGQGKLFSIYAKTSGTTDNINYTSLQILSGELQADGSIKGLQNSFYMLSKEGDQTNAKLIAPGSLRIFMDNDEQSETRATFAVDPGNTPKTQSVAGNKLSEIFMAQKAQ